MTCEDEIRTPDVLSKSPVRAMAQCMQSNRNAPAAYKVKQEHVRDLCKLCCQRESLHWMDHPSKKRMLTSLAILTQTSSRKRTPTDICQVTSPDNPQLMSGPGHRLPWHAHYASTIYYDALPCRLHPAEHPQPKTSHRARRRTQSFVCPYPADSDPDSRAF